MIPDLAPSLTESQKINLNVISLNTRINDIQTDVTKLNKVVLEGQNGELALVEQNRNNTVFIGEIKYWLKFIGGALLINIIGFSATMIIAYIKILPLLEKLATKP